MNCFWIGGAVLLVLMIVGVFGLLRIKRWQAKIALTNLERLLAFYARQGAESNEHYKEAARLAADARLSFESHDSDECMNTCAQAHLILDEVDQI